MNYTGSDRRPLGAPVGRISQCFDTTTDRGPFVLTGLIIVIIILIINRLLSSLKRLHKIFYIKFK